MAQYLILYFDVPGHMCDLLPPPRCKKEPPRLTLPSSPSAAHGSPKFSSPRIPSPLLHPRAEETKRASYSVPRAILAAFFLGGVLNFGFLMCYLYSITVMDNVRADG